jgi:hypothetical protein
MFDDDQQNKNSNPGIPNNLPVGEPEDMFAGVEKEESVVPPMDVAPPEPVVDAAPSALGAGILKPKEEMVENFQPQSPAPIDNIPEQDSRAQGIPQSIDEEIPQLNNMGGGVVPEAGSMQGGQDIYKIKEPALSKGLVRIVVVFVFVIILGGGGFWIYNSFGKEKPASQFNNDVPVVDTSAVFEGSEFAAPEVEVIEPEDIVEVEVIEPEDIAADVIDDQILFGEPIDKDADALDDERELDIGSDPNNWDTDGDDLSDGDEVIIWKTDPLNPDTDGDSYLDGAEVKGGYNPDGPGKLFEPPTDA